MSNNRDRFVGTVEAPPPPAVPRLLSSTRVLDLSRVLAGPWATQMIGDMGGDIIKVERPGFGDECRHWGPPWLKDADGNPTGESAYYLTANRNKRSVAIDIARPEGQRLIRDLAKECDVFIENYKVGTMARYGLDYASICAVRPDIIYVSLTGFGQEGPFADRPGYDYLLQGLAGLMSVNGEPEDRPGGGPQRIGIPLVDMFTGMYAAIAILAAMNHRSLTGEGQYIDLSLFDTALTLGANPLLYYLVGGKLQGLTGRASPSIAPYGVFPARDGLLIIASANQSQWVAMCKAIGRPELATDPRFVDNGARMANLQEMYRLVSEVLLTQDRAHWEALLTQAGVPVGPINDYQQAITHPQALFRGSQLALEHPSGVKVPGIASALHFSKTPVEYKRAPPLLGQHTYEVLREQLALDDEALQRLHSSGLISDAAVKSKGSSHS